MRTLLVGAVLLVATLFYLSVRFSDEAVRIDTKKAVARLRPKNKQQRVSSEILIFVGITCGGVYGLFWKKDPADLRYNGPSWFEKKVDRYGANKIEEWWLKGFASGVLKMLDYKKSVKMVVLFWK